MSTKKDKFLPKDKDYMRLAINLARARNGLTGNNPSVGCVLVKNKTIISIGQTGINGRPHAEINALKNAFSDLVVQKCMSLLSLAITMEKHLLVPKVLLKVVLVKFFMQLMI